MTSRILPVFALTLAMFSGADVRAEVGVSDSEILIGRSLSLTGATEAQGKAHVRGSDLYFKKVNDAGGVHGRRIRAITYDDVYDPQNTVANTQKLLAQDKVFILFKIYGTPNIKAIIPMIEKEDVPVFFPSSGAEFIRNPVMKNVFTLKAGYYLEAERMVDMLHARGIRKIALYYQDDAFGTEGKNATLAVLDKYKLRPVAEATYKRNSDQVEKSVEELKKSRPEAVILWSANAPGVAFAKKAREAGLTALLIGNTSLTTQDFAQSAEGAYVTLAVPLPDDADYSIARDYLKDVQAAGQTPDATSFQAYVDAATLVEGLRRAGKDLTRNSLRNAFETQMSGIGIGGLKISYSPTSHRGLSSAFLARVQNGKFVPVKSKDGK